MAQPGGSQHSKNLVIRVQKCLASVSLPQNVLVEAIWCNQVQRTPPNGPPYDFNHDLVFTPASPLPQPCGYCLMQIVDSSTATVVSLGWVEVHSLQPGQWTDQAVKLVDTSGHNKGSLSVRVTVGEELRQQLSTQANTDLAKKHIFSYPGSNPLLRLTVTSAYDLHEADRAQTTEPYVAVTLGDKEALTTCKRCMSAPGGAAINPWWNHKVELAIQINAKGELFHPELLVQIFDSLTNTGDQPLDSSSAASATSTVDPSRNRLMGHTYLLLDSIQYGRRTKVSVPLQDPDGKGRRGTLEMTLEPAYFGSTPAAAPQLVRPIHTEVSYHEEIVGDTVTHVDPATGHPVTTTTGTPPPLMTQPYSTTTAPIQQLGAPPPPPPPPPAVASASSSSSNLLVPSVNINTTTPTLTLNSPSADLLAHLNAITAERDEYKKQLDSTEAEFIKLNQSITSTNSTAHYWEGRFHDENRLRYALESRLASTLDQHPDVYASESDDSVRGLADALATERVQLQHEQMQFDSRLDTYIQVVDNSMAAHPKDGVVDDTHQLWVKAQEITSLLEQLKEKEQQLDDEKVKRREQKEEIAKMQKTMIELRQQIDNRNGVIQGMEAELGSLRRGQPVHEAQLDLEVALRQKLEARVEELSNLLADKDSSSADDAAIIRAERDRATIQELKAQRAEDELQAEQDKAHTELQQLEEKLRAAESRASEFEQQLQGAEFTAKRAEDNQRVWEDSAKAIDRRVKELQDHIRVLEEKLQTSEERARFADDQASLSADSVKTAEERLQETHSRKKKLEDDHQLVQLKLKEAHDKIKTLEDRVLAAGDPDDRVKLAEKRAAELDTLVAELQERARGAENRAEVAEVRARASENRAEMSEGREKDAESRARAAEANMKQLELRVHEGSKETEEKNWALESKANIFEERNTALERKLEEYETEMKTMKAKLLRGELELKDLEHKRRRANSDLSDRDDKERQQEEEIFSLRSKAQDAEDRLLQSESRLKLAQDRIKTLEARKLENTDNLLLRDMEAKVTDLTTKLRLAESDLASKNDELKRVKGANEASALQELLVEPTITSSTSAINELYEVEMNRRTEAESKLKLAQEELKLRERQLQDAQGSLERAHKKSDTSGRQLDLEVRKEKSRVQQLEHQMEELEQQILREREKSTDQLANTLKKLDDMVRRQKILVNHQLSALQDLEMIAKIEQGGIPAVVDNIQELKWNMRQLELQLDKEKEQGKEQGAMIKEFEEAITTMNAAHGEESSHRSYQTIKVLQGALASERARLAEKSDQLVTEEKRRADLEQQVISLHQCGNNAGFTDPASKTEIKLLNEQFHASKQKWLDEEQTLRREKDELQSKLDKALKAKRDQELRIKELDIELAYSSTGTTTDSFDVKQKMQEAKQRERIRYSDMELELARYQADHATTAANLQKLEQQKMKLEQQLENEISLSAEKDHRLQAVEHGVSRQKELLQKRLEADLEREKMILAEQEAILRDLEQEFLDGTKRIRDRETRDTMDSNSIKRKLESDLAEKVAEIASLHADRNSKSNEIRALETIKRKLEQQKLDEENKVREKTDQVISYQTQTKLLHVQIAQLEEEHARELDDYEQKLQAKEDILQRTSQQATKQRDLLNHEQLRVKMLEQQLNDMDIQLMDARKMATSTVTAEAVQKRLETEMHRNDELTAKLRDAERNQWDKEKEMDKLKAELSAQLATTQSTKSDLELQLKLDRDKITRLEDKMRENDGQRDVVEQLHGELRAAEQARRTTERNLQRERDTLEEQTELYRREETRRKDLEEKLARAESELRDIKQTSAQAASAEGDKDSYLVRMLEEELKAERQKKLDLEERSWQDHQRLNQMKSELENSLAEERRKVVEQDLRRKDDRRQLEEETKKRRDMELELENLRLSIAAKSGGGSGTTKGGSGDLRDSTIAHLQTDNGKLQSEVKQLLEQVKKAEASKNDNKRSSPELTLPTIRHTSLAVDNNDPNVSLMSADSERVLELEQRNHALQRSLQRMQSEAKYMSAVEEENRDLQLQVQKLQRDIRRAEEQLGEADTHKQQLEKQIRTIQRTFRMHEDESSRHRQHEIWEDQVKRFQEEMRRYELNKHSGSRRGSPLPIRPTTSSPSRRLHDPKSSPFRERATSSHGHSSAYTHSSHRRGVHGPPSPPPTRYAPIGRTTITIPVEGSETESTFTESEDELPTPPSPFITRYAPSPTTSPTASDEWDEDYSPRTSPRSGRGRAGVREVHTHTYHTVHRSISPPLGRPVQPW